MRHLRQSWCALAQPIPEFPTCSMPVNMHEATMVSQVRTGTTRSMKGHRDPALTWEVPPALQKVSIRPVYCVPIRIGKAVYILSDLSSTSRKAEFRYAA